MKDFEKKLPDLKKFFQKNKIVLAVLFGSVAAGKEGRLSDVDFAVLLESNVPASKYFDIQLKLMGELRGFIKGRRVDLVILNEASPLLAQMVLSKGKVIFCQNDDLKARFYAKVLQESEDTRFLRREFYKYLRERVLKNKLGEKLYA